MNDRTREQLDMCSHVYDQLTTELAEKHLSDSRRRGLILALRSLFHLRRKCLREAESLGTIAPGEATKLRLECARAGLAVCDEQEAVMFKRVHAPELSATGLCSLVHTVCILMAMIRQLEKEFERATRKIRPLKHWAEPPT